MKRMPPGRAITAALVVAAMTAACTATAEPPPKPVLERTAIRVGVISGAGAAPAYIAQKKGYFAQEGLTVELETTQGAASSLAEVQVGNLDLAQTDYVSSFVAGAAGMDFKVVGDLHKAGQDTFALLVGEKSRIRSVADLKGKKVAVNVLNGIGSLAVALALKDAGLERRDVKLIETPYPDMETVLADRKVDAVVSIEPFSTVAEQHGKVRELSSAGLRRTKDLPVAGWVTAGAWRESNPATLAAFKRALAKAQRVAAADRKEAEAVLPTYLKIDSGLIPKIPLGVYPTAADPQGLQRVADLMDEFQYVDSPVDVTGVTN